MIYGICQNFGVHLFTFGVHARIDVAALVSHLAYRGAARPGSVAIVRNTTSRIHGHVLTPAWAPDSKSTSEQALSQSREGLGMNHISGGTHDALHPARSGVRDAFLVPQVYCPSRFTIIISIIPTEPGQLRIGRSDGGMNWIES